jgi:hypothetical protein
MKKPQFAVLLLLAASSIAFGQEDRRVLLERRLEIAYAKVAVFTSDSPLLEHLLQSAKAANQSAGSDVWQAIKPEFSEAATSVLMADGGPLGGALHPALASLSDSELDHLVLLIEDPVFGRFQAALASPEVQRVSLAAVSKKAMLLGPALNAVLAKHGLREVH